MHNRLGLWLLRVCALRKVRLLHGRKIAIKTSIVCAGARHWDSVSHMVENHAPHACIRYRDKVDWVCSCAKSGTTTSVANV